MAVSQALGSNVFDIFLCLGLPWTIKTWLGVKTVPVEDRSGMLLASTFTLLATVVVLMLFMLKKWTLGKKFGAVLVVLYFAYLIVAALAEVYVFRNTRIATCPGNY